MTRVRRIDASGDWTFGKGKNDYADRTQAIAQNIATRLRSFLGDCFFDLAAGIDWFNQLGGKDKTSLNLSVAAVILNTPQVTALNQLSIVLDVKRNLTITYSVKTIYGLTGGNVAFTPLTYSRLQLEQTGYILI